jgi:alkylation response protein AidB-like acyl-CoA dehydrogenase
MIDFTLTEEQRQIQKSSRAYAQDVLTSASKAYAHLPTQRERFESTRPLFRRAVAAGQLKAGIPAPLGGLSKSLVDAAISMEEQYATDTSLTLTVAANLLGLMPLFFVGTPEQHEKFLKPFLSGEGEPLASLVHSEPGGTANWLVKGAPGLQTTAKKEGGHWIINGTKVRRSLQLNEYANMVI